jgi:hypothetical protein
MCAKELFQIIIGTWELRDAIAVEQTRPITAADFDKMVDSRRERHDLAGYGLRRRERNIG